MSNSDDFVCNHGDPDAARTIAACARLRNPNAEIPPDEQPVQAGAPPASETSGNLSSGAYQRGVADRQRYENWYHGLSGDYLAGASYWAANRSVPGHAPCDGPGSPSVSANWDSGCRAAQFQLGEPDQLRRRYPDYRLGWNSIPNDQPVSQTAAAEPPVPDTPVPPPSPVADQTVSSDPTPTPPPQNSSSAAATGVAIGAVLVGLVVICLGLALYFLPTLVAMGRRKRNVLAIFALNLCLGWTVLGWVLALVWSLSIDPQVA